MRYYLDMIPAPEEGRWRQLGRKVLAVAVLLAALALTVCLVIFFFSVFAAIAATVVIVGLLALLINSFRHPRTY